MNKRKTFPILFTVSLILIIAGVILAALLGFNRTLASGAGKSFEVDYDVVFGIQKPDENGGTLEDSLQTLCEQTFAGLGLGWSDKKIEREIDRNSGRETGDSRLIYTFGADADAGQLGKAVETVNAALSAPDGIYASASEKIASWHVLADETFNEGVWRGAIAIAVGAIVALIYIAVRFGVASALTGLVLCAHDTLLTIALVALTRIPVLPFAPMLYGAAAAFLSVLFWLIHAMKLRETAKDPAFAGISAAERYEEADKVSFKPTLYAAIGVAAVVAVTAVIGAIASTGFLFFALPMLIPVAVALYSSLLLASPLYVPIRKPFERFETRTKKYAGKQKAEKAEE